MEKVSVMRHSLSNISRTRTIFKSRCKAVTSLSSHMTTLSQRPVDEIVMISLGVKVSRFAESSCLMHQSAVIFWVICNIVVKINALYYYKQYYPKIGFMGFL